MSTMRVVCEFDLAKPGINDDRHREKTRIIEDENGIWRLQSKSAEGRMMVSIGMKGDPDGWQDEFKLDGWPHGDKIGGVEYSERVLNMSSTLKATFEAGRKA